jgi:16S rRNA (cytosine1402-N4)-methyltransferase
MMSSDFVHTPVMVDEVVEVFDGVPAGIFVDANAGGAGHADAVLSAHAGLRLIGFDRDRDALEAARRRLAPFGARADLHHLPFDRMHDVISTQGDSGDVSAVLFDLGISSPQVDRADRGFSFHDDGPLDMRFDQSSGRSAADLVNDATDADIEMILRTNADEPNARSIARAIVAARPLVTTLDLVEVVAGAVPAAYRRQGHPARRTFQAIRMAVNDELGQLRSALVQAIDLLGEGGRVAVLTYHSGEDRIVKQLLRDAVTGGCTCPPDLPCGCGAVRRLVLLRPITRTPSSDEIAANPRARSARLRAAEKLAVITSSQNDSVPTTSTTAATRTGATR